MTNLQQTQSGNAIIWIFIAVGLFAALSYTFMQSSRTSTSIITDSQAQAYAQDIIAYGNEVKQAVKRMQLKGVKEHEFDFSNNVYKLENGTPWPAGNAACTSNKCKLFHIEGGGMQAKYAPSESRILNVPLGGSSSGQGNFRTGYFVNIGTAEPELNFEYTYINEKTCLKINEILNIENPGGSPPFDDYSGSQANYAGTLTTFPIPIGTEPIGNEATQLTGKKSFCLTANGTYFNYKQVLIPR